VQQKGTLDSLVDALPSNEFRSLVEGA